MYRVQVPVLTDTRRRPTLADLTQVRRAPIEQRCGERVEMSHQMLPHHKQPERAPEVRSAYVVRWLLARWFMEGEILE